MKREWTEPLLEQLLRAHALYDRQTTLMQGVEFPTVTVAKLDSALRRARPKKKALWKLPEGEQLPLLIETEPMLALEGVERILALPGCSQLLKVPKVIQSLVIPENHPTVLRLRTRLHEAENVEKDLRLRLDKALDDDSVFYRTVLHLQRVVQPLPALPEEYLAAVPASTGEHEVDAVLVLSDEHSDTVVEPQQVWGVEWYNFHVHALRTERLISTVKRYVTTLLPAHKIRRLWIFSLGDKVQGDIHDGKHRNHFSNSVEAALAVGEIQAQMIQQLAPLFPGGIHYVGVSGNHGRLTMQKDYRGPRDNYDFVAASVTELCLRNEIEAGRVTVHLPDSWTAFVRVCNSLWCLNHGDDVIGYAGHPWYGFDRKNNRVQALVGEHNERVDNFVYGHYHTGVVVPTAGAMSFHNGAWYRTDPHAQVKLSVGNTPEQWLFLMADDFPRPVLPIPIFLEDPEREQAMARGELMPTLGHPGILERLDTLPWSHGFQVLER